MFCTEMRPFMDSKLSLTFCSLVCCELKISSGRNYVTSVDLNARYSMCLNWSFKYWNFLLMIIL